MSSKVCAKGRGGVINVRNGNFKEGVGFAVDAKVPGHKSEVARKGRIFRFFPTKDKAQAFADKINAGEHPELGKQASGAIVVKAYNAPAEGQPWPWETPASKSA